jgi:site-specific recombinase XerD
MGQVVALNAKRVGRQKTELAIDAMEQFLAEYRGIAGRSLRSARSQRWHISGTLQWCAERLGVELDELELVAIDRDLIAESLLAYRVGTDGRFTRNEHSAPAERANSSMARRISAVRTFFGWCCRTDRLFIDPTLSIANPGIPNRMPEFLDEDQARRVLQAAAESTWPLRDVAIMALALGAGPRLFEMAGAQVSRLEGDPPAVLTVMGKRSKERRLHLAGVPSGAMSAWLTERAVFLASQQLTSDALFVSSRPRKVGLADGSVRWDCSLSGPGLGEVFSRTMEASGLRKPGVRTHVCRHTFATLALNSGSHSLKALQDALGHASIATLGIYLHVTDADLAAAAVRHPMST